MLEKELLGYSEYKIRKEFSNGKFVTGGFYGSFENGNINAVMDGDIDGFINAYLKAQANK